MTPEGLPGPPSRRITGLRPPILGIGGRSQGVTAHEPRVPARQEGGPGTTGEPGQPFQRQDVGSVRPEGHVADQDRPGRLTRHTGRGPDQGPINPGRPRVCGRVQVRGQLGLGSRPARETVSCSSVSSRRTRKWSERQAASRARKSG